MTLKCDALARDLKDSQDQFTNEKAALERRIRSLQEQNQSLQEDVDDKEALLSSGERQYKHQLNEVETKRLALEKTVEELQSDLQDMKGTLQITQDRLSQRDREAGDYEAEILRLKAQTGDSQTLEVIKREMSEQVHHIRGLEATNREQAAELKHMRKVQRSIEMVEEEKKSLEMKLQMMKDVERQLNVVQVQKQALEDEKRSWTSFLESEGQENEFDSPEAMVRALIQERIEKASLLDTIGKTTPDLLEKDEIIKSLEDDKIKLQQEVEKLSKSDKTTFDSKTLQRIERQKALAVKEVEYLRAQLKTFDTEETTFQIEHHYDEQKTKQIQELEALVDQYRTELSTLHTSLQQAEKPPNSTPEPQLGSKRPLSPSPEDERIATLNRKNRHLQNALTETQKALTLAQNDLSATKTQLSSFKSTSRPRILSLRSNPTSDFENYRLSSITKLREENRDLLTQLQGDSAAKSVKVVPLSSFEATQTELEEQKALVAEKEKRMLRLKQIWTAKSLEFREAIASLLGYKIDFQPNGRVVATSMFKLGDRSGEGEDDEGANSITFDGEQGTMKIAGGPNGAFAREIKDLIRFWVDERKDVPCFMAAMTLEFYEQTTRAAKA
jgi:mitotic spindle assembly checkpoint protein MAD1